MFVSIMYMFTSGFIGLGPGLHQFSFRLLSLNFSVRKIRGVMYLESEKTIGSKHPNQRTKDNPLFGRTFGKTLPLWETGSLTWRFGKFAEMSVDQSLGRYRKNGVYYMRLRYCCIKIWCTLFYSYFVFFFS